MNKIFCGDSLEILKTLPDQSVQTCVTSPPYFGLRDYGVEGQIGLEETPEEYVQKLVEVFKEVRRVLRDDGTLWLNLGDSYATNTPNGFQGKNGGRKDRAFTAENLPAKKAPGLKAKDLIGIPWRVAFALQQDGWYLRQDIIWHKPNPMPESVTDRCTKAHEYIFLLSKNPKYYFDNEAVSERAVTDEGRPAGIVRDRTLGYNSKQKVISAMWKVKAISAGRVPGGNKKVDASRNDASRDMNVPVAETRNRRSVWTVATKPYKGAHFATFPPDLIEPCILAGAPVGGVVLDPFLGSGTTVAVAIKHGRQYIGIELNPEYIKLAEQRLGTVTPLLIQTKTPKGV